MTYKILTTTARSIQSTPRAAVPHQSVSLVSSRRKLLLGASTVGLGSLVSNPGHAVGIESVDIPSFQRPGFVDELNKRNQAALDAAEESFQNSELLKSLKDRTEANKDKLVTETRKSRVILTPTPCTCFGFGTASILAFAGALSKNKKELFDRYCKRQAELGVGDCGGLRYIPGMTKSGVQERPAWLEKLFGSE